MKKNEHLIYPLRGGSWFTYLRVCTSTSRCDYLMRKGIYDDVGFRIVRKEKVNE